MNLLTDKYYIIRTGDFATDANKKIVYILLSVVLCLHDSIINKNIEYFAIMICSSIIWTIIELLLNEQKVRVIKPMKITWNNQTNIINKYVGISLQGIQEGGAVTIIGLYFGDRFGSIFYQCFYHLLIFYMVVNIGKKKSNIKTLSKRQINTPCSLCLMSSAAIFNIWVIVNNPSHIYRELNMFMSMVYISSIWTIISYYKDFRKVEIYLYNNHKYVCKPNTLIDAFVILGYDVVFEIGIAYITFYNMFIIPYNNLIETKLLL
tara:strand:- start:253 stop:1041 length:789 start_codon:yes stop_codon:yes gene_type:complete